ncbi:MAG: YegS/Rv2252/BmrU family lipid kinase [Longimicrobiales bacterium]
MIFNPASGRGRGRRRIEAYKGLLRKALPDVHFATTTRPGEERELAARAATDGYDVVVGVGGDGTWSNVADGLMATGRKDVALGVLPSGTGNDFGRNLGFDPRDPAVAVAALAAGTLRLVDVGYVATPSAADRAPDQWETRHFLNLAGFGFDVAVIDAAAGARFLRGELLYKLTALQQLFRFIGFACAVDAADGVERQGRHLMITVSNGRYFGGGFPIAPDASVSDGRLHACRIGDAGPLRRLRLFNLAERGRHVGVPGVEVVGAQRFRLGFDEPPRFELDGDVRRAAGATVELHVLPGALAVVAPTASR